MVTVTVSGDSVEEVKQGFLSLFGGTETRAPVETAQKTEAEEPTPVGQTSSTPRRRRTKAEMEADKAAELAPAVHPVVAEPAPVEQTSFDDMLVVEPVVKKEVTIQDCLELVKSVGQSKPEVVPAIVQILAGMKVKRVADLSATQTSDFFAKVKAL